MTCQPLQTALIMNMLKLSDHERTSTNSVAGLLQAVDLTCITDDDILEQIPADAHRSNYNQALLEYTASNRVRLRVAHLGTVRRTTRAVSAQRQQQTIGWTNASRGSGQSKHVKQTRGRC